MPNPSASGSTPDSTSPTPRQKVENIRLDLEANFTTWGTAEARLAHVNQELTAAGVGDCESNCLRAYTNCRNAGGTPAVCQIALNVCLTGCGV